MRGVFVADGKATGGPNSRPEHIKQGAIKELIAAGKVRHFGLSEASALAYGELPFLCYPSKSTFCLEEDTDDSH